MSAADKEILDNERGLTETTELVRIIKCRPIFQRNKRAIASSDGQGWMGWVRRVGRPAFGFFVGSSCVESFRLHRSQSDWDPDAKGEQQRTCDEKR